MRTLSPAFYERLKADKRHYYHILNFHFKDGSTREVRDNQIWDGGVSFDDAVSSDSSFDLGAVIIGKCTIQLNNLYDDFPKSLVFEGARVDVRLGIFLNDVHTLTETLEIGEYTVTEAKYTGSIIQLECLDNLNKFDKSYTTDVVFPAKIKDIFYDSCSKCEVTPQELRNPSSDSRYNFVVGLDPDKMDNLTHRQALSYVAQICGRFVTVDSNGHPGMGWYNFSKLSDAASEIESDQFVDPDKMVHKLTGISSLSVGIDPIVITGVKITGRHKVMVGGKEEEQEFSRLAGTEGYVVTIADNPFIRTPSDAESILGWLGPDLVGKSFYKANVSHLNSPAIEAGDVAYVRDRKGNYYPILISSTKFRAGQVQTSVSAATDPIRNSADHSTALAKTYTDLLQRIDREKSSRELAIEDLNNRIGDGDTSGLYVTTKADVDGGKILYMHDKPKLDESGTVWIISRHAMAVTTDPDIAIADGVITDNSTYQYGFTSGGNLLANLISVVSIQAENIRLYGDMTVFVNGEAGAAAGGVIGYGLGQSGWGTTRGIHLLSVNAMAEVIATTDGARISYGDNSSVMALDKSTQLYYKVSTGAREYYIQANEDRAEMRGQNLNTSTGYLTRVFAGTTSAGAQCVGKANNRVASLYLEDGIVGMYAGTTSAYSTTYSSRIFVSEDDGARIRSNKLILIYAAGAKARLESEDEVLISYCVPKGDSWTYYPRFVADSLGAHLKYGNDTKVEATSTGITLDSASAVSVGAGSSFGVSVNGTGKIDINSATTLVKYNNSNKLEITSTFTKIHAGLANVWTRSTDDKSGAMGWTNTSDRRKKRDIKSDIDGDLIDLLNPVSFKWIGGESKQVGLIAQEVQEVIPEIVSEEPGSEEHYLGVAYTSLIPFLIKKCQTQQQQINDLEARLSRLEAMINA